MISKGVTRLSKDSDNNTRQLLSVSTDVRLLPSIWAEKNKSGIKKAKKRVKI